MSASRRLRDTVLKLIVIEVNMYFRIIWGKVILQIMFIVHQLLHCKWLLIHIYAVTIYRAVFLSFKFERIEKRGI